MNILYIIYFLLSPIIYLLLIIFSLFNSKIYEHLKNQRESIKNVLDKKLENPIIMHAASAGEYEQIKPFLKSNKNHSFSVIQTFFSPTIFNKEKKSDLFDACCYHPFDFPWSAFIFFRLIKPKKYIVCRHDIWPHHIFFAKLMNVKLLYINANLKHDTIRKKFIFKNFNEWLFNHFDYISVPSEDIRYRMSKYFNLDQVNVIQDSRFIQINNRIKKNIKIELLKNLDYNKTITFGSIDQSDWKLIRKNLNVINSLKLNVIIVPHEIRESFIQKIVTDIKEHNFSFQRITDESKNKVSNFIIYDKVGDLLDIYKYGSRAYVGCGLSTGVHNVLEPALQKCYVSFGPNISLLDEAVELKRKKLCKIIYNHDDLKDFLKRDDCKYIENKRLQISNLFKLKIDDFNTLTKIIYDS